MPYSQKFPLRLSDRGYYFQSNHTIGEHIIEMLKMLLLTTKGEYLMDFEYGVGINNYLFNPINDKLKNTLKSDIRSQITKYVERCIVDEVYVHDYIDAQNGKISAAVSDYYKLNNFDIGPNDLSVVIVYKIEGINDESNKMFSIVAKG